MRVKFPLILPKSTAETQVIVEMAPASQAGVVEHCGDVDTETWAADSIHVLTCQVFVVIPRSPPRYQYWDPIGGLPPGASVYTSLKNRPPALGIRAHKKKNASQSCTPCRNSGTTSASMDVASQRSSSPIAINCLSPKCGRQYNKNVAHASACPQPDSRVRMAALRDRMQSSAKEIHRRRCT
eukprot:SAG31_NODE_4585_length_3116_cov_5.020882_1_plen_182_part_00